MKMYAISDTHFGHEKLIEYGRPDNFSELILDNLSEMEGDILIHCGDFCIGDDVEWHNRFFLATQNFKRKILVRGNHEAKSYNWYYDQGWNFVCKQTVLRICNKLVLFTHRPLAVESKGALDFNFHGHLHGGGKDSHRQVEGGTYSKPFHQDLAPDTNNYKPVNLDLG